jgi:hypothetical protein
LILVSLPHELTVRLDAAVGSPFATGVRRTYETVAAMKAIESLSQGVLNIFVHGYIDDIPIT